MYIGWREACGWREGEDDEDDEDVADEVGEGLSDRSDCRDLRKEVGGVREMVGVSTEMSWQDIDGDCKYNMTIWASESLIVQMYLSFYLGVQQHRLQAINISVNNVKRHRLAVLSSNTTCSVNFTEALCW